MHTFIYEEEHTNLAATLQLLALAKRKAYDICFVGMGCSAGIISVDLARQMLELTPNKYALVVSTENITLNW